MNFLEQYNSWLESELVSQELKNELLCLKDNASEIEDRFYKNLEFGTAGLRGKIGAGTNRMNIMTVGRATQGLANYLLKKCCDSISVAIAYDSRLKSDEFADIASRVLVANGIKVYLYSEIKSTPQLSFAVRHFGCDAGIVITASHNSYIYNGYKVYNSLGGQIIEDEATAITEEINNLSIENVKFSQFSNTDNIIIIDKSIDDLYISKVKSLSLMSDDSDKNLKVVYTPLHGTGFKPVTRIFDEMGYKNLYLVKEQILPDSMFPTVEYPNPEDINAYKIAIEYAKKYDADIVLATDPDCDRVGVVVKNSKTDEYVQLTGNQIGALLTDYILKLKSKNNSIKNNSIIINSVVTSDLSEKIAKDYGVKIYKTLTGFKYIAEKITKCENDIYSFVFGFEESYGYLYGDFVRDKDAVIASMLISEMTEYYKKSGQTLLDALSNLYHKYGYYIDEVISFTVEGLSGKNKISKIIEYFRENKPNIINGTKITNLYDYKLSIHYDLITGDFDKILLPKSNVLKFCFEDESWFVIRPSGTEPKIKVYFSLTGKSEQETKERLENIKTEVFAIMNCIV